jgi:hypothetical protein
MQLVVMCVGVKVESTTTEEVKKMKTFRLVRKEDVSGVSGTGEVAEGVEFHDGQTVLSWFGQFHTIEVLPHIADVEAIHGHGGKTVVVFDREEVGRGKEIPLYKRALLWLKTHTG